MDQPMTEEESYADRRQLFKNIWDTAINIDKNVEKQEGNVNKPKVIKTARLDEINRCVAEKKKKQRIKNLRIVCNKILDFCDIQDADEMFYEQMASKAKASSKRRENRMRMKSKAIKIWKAEKAKRMFPSVEYLSQTGITSPNIFFELNTSSSSSSPTNPKRTTLTVQQNRKREKIKRKEKFFGNQPSNCSLYQLSVNEEMVAMIGCGHRRIRMSVTLRAKIRRCWSNRKKGNKTKHVKNFLWCQGFDTAVS